MGMGMRKHNNHNPAVSGEQYRMAQAVLSGESTGMPVKVAREIVDRTPAKMRSKWSKRNPEGPAADMYESFHGAPSEQLVTFEEEEHYHEYLAELGVCCGVLVETVDGSVQAIGLSGYTWEGKGKDAGFVEMEENGNRRRNPAPKDASEDFKAGYKYYLSKIRTAKGSFLTSPAALKYSQKFGEKDMNAAFMSESVKARVRRAQEAYTGFIDGADQAHQDRIREQRGEENPKRTAKGPFTQASDLVFGGAKAGLSMATKWDSKLGKALKGNPPETYTDLAYGNQYQKRGNQWFILKSHRSPGYVPGQGWEKIDKSEYKFIQSMIQRGKLVKPSKANPADSVDPNTTLLCSNEDGTQLYLQGGDQSLDLASLGITGDAATKELITVGVVCKIHYETAKDFDKFETIQYHHELGEETGELPVLAYDRMNKRLLFVGGAYRIEKPMFETSPGIEN